MAQKNVELLLLDTIEHLGIVGDVVKVRPGYARNYLLPMLLAEKPTAEKIDSLKEARAAALAKQAQMRSDREALIEKLADMKLVLVRSCNDQGQLYGAVTQRDIADELTAQGHPMDMRAVRLSNPIRRIGAWVCTIQFDRDLKTDIHVHVNADRALDIAAPETAAPASGAGEDAAAEGDTGGGTGDKGGESTSRKPRAGKGKAKAADAE
ncbi:MAG: 50S ribosomal protein L9 [Phycisphaerales bacterium]|nr:50S ribosomal protein L9 [Phycisphaerales bacterium]